jgi:uncharacterized repeat protein (TIGR03803 family)
MKTKYPGTALLGIALALLIPAAAVAQTYTQLYTYPNTDNNTSGITYESVLAQGQDGELYSTIQTNGAYNEGSVYKISTTGQYDLIYSFCAEGGACKLTGGIPDGGVTLGFDGNFWGTTQNGGTDAAGTAFKITPSGTLTTLYSFTNTTDDSAPSYTLIQGQDGNMYGVSEEQYAGQAGSFFKMTTKGKIAAHPFNPNFTDGASPNLPVQGYDGNFYGSIQIGGDLSCNLHGCGAIYKMTAAGKVTLLHSFTGYVSTTQYDGAFPYGTLTQDANGNLYGTTNSGGSANTGTIFKITPSGNYTLLHSFVNAPPAYDGVLPTAGPTLGTDGNIYGTTEKGGTQNGGAIYKITPSGTETLLYSFCVVSCYDGFVPTTSMLLDTNGKFYGVTSGNSNGGSVFYSFDVGLNPFVKLVTWTGKVGAKVEILGQGFTGATAVSFDGVAAKFVVVSDTYLTATVPTGALTGSITVKTSSATLKSDRVFVVPPQVKSFSPASGPVGTSVTITGVSLTQTTAVTIGGKAASFTVNSDTQVTAIVPAGAKTGKTITITTAGGKAASTTKFTVT